MKKPLKFKKENKIGKANMSDITKKPDAIKENAINLYKYLQHMVKLRTSVVLDTGKYIDTIWLSDIPYDTKHCYCSAWNLEKEDTESIWIDIKRPILPKVPTVPEKCVAWVDASTLDNYEKEPVLKDKIVNILYEVSNAINDASPYLEIGNFPDIQSAWREYVDKKWKPWAQTYGPLKKVQDLYTRLFSMYQQQKALGESYEVVMGLGLLNYKTKQGAVIYRHILYAQTEIAFEPNRGAISVKASVEGANLQFETEMLDSEDLPPIEIQHNLENAAKDIGNDIWDKARIHSLIRSWTNSFNSKAQYSEEMALIGRSESHENPEVGFSPALILRERTKVGILKFIAQIIEKIKKDPHGAVPPSVQVLVTAGVDTGTPQAPEGENDGKDEDLLPEEIYFPLPSNEEQLTIIKNLYRSKGVLVQGPPGTGKSHTIANLICHLLATGKKVLVTSQTTRALKVLNEKLPEEIRPLCVSILGNRQEDLDNLMGAVHQITNQNNVYDKDRSQKKISSLEKDLLDLKKKRQEVKVFLAELREKETYKHTIVDGKYNGTAEEIAKRLKNEESRYGWIPDEISAEDPQPITHQELKNLIASCRKFSKEYQKELSQKRVFPTDVFPPEEFVQLVNSEQKFVCIEQGMDTDIKVRMLYEKIRKADSIKRGKLLHALQELEKARSEACRRPLPWLKEAVSEILGEQDRPLKDLASVTKMHLEGLREIAIEADKNNFLLPKDKELQKIKADAEDLLQHLAAGKKLGWWVFRPSIYKKISYLLTEVQVNGRLCDNVQCLTSIISYIDAQTRISKLIDAWKNKISITTGTLFNQVAIIAEHLEALEVILSIENYLLESKRLLRDLEVISEPSWHDENEIQRLITTLDGSLAIDGKRDVEEKMDKARTLLKVIASTGDGHPVNTDLLEALESRDWAKWTKLYERITTLYQDALSLQECDNLLARLRTKASLLADLICENPHDDIIEKCSDDFDKAWDWLRADAWLREFEQTHDEYQLQRDHEDLDKRIGKILAKLASEKSWLSCLSSITEVQRQNLMAWSHAIKKIGKGTGKHAEKHRKEAEGYMVECRGAIPAWIMPMFRVTESIKPDKEIFDVVIVDESSQSGPDALSLFYLAKKCIIVGDDQQISPEDIGIDQQEIDKLIELYLNDLPLKKTYGLQSSLFTHAQIRYKSRVVLQEHFRCVPEIIQFSNQLCYAPLGHSLVPLRSCPPRRLDPVKTMYVKSGYKDGFGQRVVNIPEADAMVEEIAKCCANPEYKGKTMGVIVLQGHAQNSIIEKALIEKIGTEEMERRNLICGDPYDFQGDERDVIFLSLVAAPNERIGVLGKETDKRRFNVAFSRARDQLWLFHSATLNDLSPNDYRYKLLAYCLDPLKPQGEIFNPRGEKGPEIFDSQFEKDVCSKITSKGYRVIPQFRVAEYRIDLVVEGVKARLAIECDGDAWHGPEAYEKDQWRQRVLERAGWRFWRIRGSMFYRDPDQALESLWHVLEEMGIASVLEHKKDEEAKISQSETTEIHHIEAREELADNKETLIADASYDDDRLSAVMAYAEKEETAPHGAKYSETQLAILEVLRESSVGKDLIADKVLRKIGYTCRGRSRDKLRRRVLRVITDMKRQGIVEEYETDKRKRVKLLNGTQQDLFTTIKNA